MQVDPHTFVRIPRSKAGVGPTSGPTWRLSHLRGAAQLLAEDVIALLPPTRVRSYCRFRNRGTEYVSESCVKRMSSSAKQRCDRALPPPRAQRVDRMVLIGVPGQHALEKFPPGQLHLVLEGPDGPPRVPFGRGILGSLGIRAAAPGLGPAARPVQVRAHVFAG